MLKTAPQLVTEARSQISTVDAAAAHRLYTDELGTKHILDVREADSAATSQLTEAVNIPRGLLEMVVTDQCPEPHSLILVHCAGGGRASLAALTLKQMGYTNVHAIVAPYDDLHAIFG